MRMERDWIIRKSLSIDCMRVRSTQFVLYVVLHTMNYKSKATIIQYTTIHLYLHRELPTSSLPLKPILKAYSIPQNDPHNRISLATLQSINITFFLQINTPDPPYIECVQSYSHTFVIKTEYSRYMESPEIIQEIPPLVLKSLGDRSYDKRKKAAFEIESIVHQMHVEYEN